MMKQFCHKQMLKVSTHLFRIKYKMESGKVGMTIVPGRTRGEAKEIFFSMAGPKREILSIDVNGEVR